MSIQSQFKYLGAFRLPQGTFPADHNPNAYPTDWIDNDFFGFAGSPLHYDAFRKLLIVGSKVSRVISVNIPIPVISQNVNDLPIATPAADRFVSPFLGTFQETNDENDITYTGLGGIHATKSTELTGSGITYYDANNHQRRGHRISSWPPLANAPLQNLTPWRTVGTPYQDGDITVNPNGQQGIIAGYMGWISNLWQKQLKGKVFTGQAGLPIIYRGSTGPAFLSFNPEEMYTKQDVPARFLIGYPNGHATLGPWAGSSPLYGMTTRISGAVFSGDKLVFFGTNGVGPACYGTGTNDPAKHDWTDPATGTHYCYDLSNNNQGNHSYPYVYEVWEYNLSDVARVANGEITPWSLVPTYENWIFEGVPVPPNINPLIGGVTQDFENNLIYISRMYEDYGAAPIIEVYQCLKDNGGSVITPPVPPPVDPCYFEKERIKQLEAENLSLQQQLTYLTEQNEELQEENQGLATIVQQQQTKLRQWEAVRTEYYAMYDRIKKTNSLPKWLKDQSKKIYDMMRLILP